MTIGELYGYDYDFDDDGNEFLEFDVENEKRFADRIYGGRN